MNDAIKAVVDQAIADKVFPGAVVGFIKHGQRTVLPFGKFTYDTASPAVSLETVYDLASVTKTIPTNSIILKLIEDGRLSADDPVVKFVPELAMAGRDQILIKHLLTFTVLFALKSRLTSYASGGAAAIYRAIYESPLAYPPGEHYHYSNAPIILLAQIAERVSNQPLDKLADRLFFRPLGMASTSFHPEQLDLSRVPPTEINQRGEVRGQVHDETAWALYQKSIIGGHAGLFSTAGDLLTFGEMLLNGGELAGRRCFKTETVGAMSREVFNDSKFGMALGWELKQSDYMSPALPANVFGKDGFTGTLILIEPINQTCLVILSNRTYPERPENSDAINRVRRQIEDVVFLDS